MTPLDAVKRTLALLLPAILAATAAGAAGVEAKAGSASIGPFGLEVAVGISCTPGDLPLGGELAGLYEACDKITAAGATVPSQASFTAGAAVTLGDDFSVAAGATFSAVIAPLIASDFAYLEDDTPQSFRSYKARFDVKLDDLALAGGDRIELLNGYSANGDEWFRLALDGGSGVVLEARRDSGGYASAPLGAIIPAGFHTLELAWIARSGTDGELMLKVDDGAPAGVSLDNDTGRIDHVRVGAVDGVVTTTTGVIHLDEFLSFR